MFFLPTLTEATLVFFSLFTVFAARIFPGLERRNLESILLAGTVTLVVTLFPAEKAYHPAVLSCLAGAWTYLSVGVILGGKGRSQQESQTYLMQYGVNLILAIGLAGVTLTLVAFLVGRALDSAPAITIAAVVGGLLLGAVLLDHGRAQSRASTDDTKDS